MFDSLRQFKVLVQNLPQKNVLSILINEYIFYLMKSQRMISCNPVVNHDIKILNRKF